MLEQRQKCELLITILQQNPEDDQNLKKTLDGLKEELTQDQS